MKKQEPVMDWPGILAELHRRGMTLSELSRIHGIPYKSATRVKSSTHYKMQQVVAEFIGHKPEELWPSRYPIGKPRILDTTKYPPVASQNAQPGADKRAAE